ncbi:MAG: ImmA/IrrE family metallo-endopeptidase, partial [Dehalococcoidia bacterium]
MIRADINPDLLRWAVERAGLTMEGLAQRFPRLEAWGRGEAQPTLKQVEDFAKATHAPVGYLFLPEPPVEHVPIPDFRTVGNVHIDRPSPDLLDMLYVCQQRQEWYRDFARSMGEPPLPFAGSVQVGANVVATATAIREALGFDLEERREIPTWTDALRHFIGQADALGVMVMVTSVVLNNTHRRLNALEFRGFALADDLAPLVFINGADTKAGQMFTLAHELAHIWAGQSALTDAQPSSLPEHEVERWCNQVAAELLAPLSVMRVEYRPWAGLWGEAARLAKRFKVSTLVVLRRIHDIGGLTLEQFRAAYVQELQRLLAMPRGSGGDFYLSQAARVSKRFAR